MFIYCTSHQNQPSFTKYEQYEDDFFSIFHYRFLKFYLEIKNFELKFDLMYRRNLYVCNAYIYIFEIGGMTGGKYRKRDVCCIVWDLRWRVFLIFDCFDSISQKFYSIYILRNDFLFIYGFFSHQLIFL